MNYYEKNLNYLFRNLCFFYTCPPGYVCTPHNEFYNQCLPDDGHFPLCVEIDGPGVQVPEGRKKCVDGWCTKGYAFFYYILLPISCLFLSCHSAYSPDFPREETITQELMPLQGVTYQFWMAIRHPYLIVENLQRTDSIFHIYDLTTYELKSAFGIMGRGPREFVSPILIKSPLPGILIGTGDDLVHLYDIDKDGSPVFKGTKQPNYIDGAANASFINDSLFVIDGDFLSPGFLHLFTYHDELPRKSWKYGDPSILYRDIDPNYGWVYANQSRIVFCYKFKKQIDFMDIDFNLIKRVKFKYKPPSNISEENQLEVKNSYGFGYMGNRFLYTLFVGAPWPEYGDPSYRGSVLEVYDLDGNPIIKYHLDGMAPLSYFVVNEETYTLYGCWREGEPEDHLLVYRLKGLS